MPELPEVEITRRGLLPLVNQTVKSVVVRNPALRWPVPAHLSDTLVNQTLTSLSRRAKYILAHFDRGVLLIHLGMSGRISVLSEHVPPEKHDHVDIVFADGRVLRMRDPRRFGAVLWLGADVDNSPLLKNLGPEPLSADFSAEYLHAQTRQRRAPIKTALMNQQLVVGVGNIYASESLFRARIHPELSAHMLKLKDCERLVQEIKLTLEAALSAGGSSLRDFFGTDGNPGYFQQEYFVYGRTGEPCKVCGKAIASIRLAQRSTFYCPKCQP